MEALTTASGDNEVYVDLFGGGPEYTVSMRPREHNGSDNPTVVPAHVGSATHRERYTHRQQHFYGTGQLQQIPVEASSGEDDGNEADSEGQSGDSDGGGRGRATVHGDAGGGRRAKRKWKMT